MFVHACVEKIYGLLFNQPVCIIFVILLFCSFVFLFFLLFPDLFFLLFPDNGISSPSSVCVCLCVYLIEGSG